MVSKTALFPFPHRIGATTYDGSVISAPDACRNCSTPRCVAAQSRELELCAFGYNYQQLGGGITVVGLVVREYHGTSQARSKRLREQGSAATPRQHVESAVAAYAKAADEFNSDLEAEKARLLREYQESSEFGREILQKVRADIQRGMALFHDYKQINSAITRNINVVLETRYKDVGDLPAKVAAAHPSERAIYEAAKFLDEKLNVAQFLMTPEWLLRKSECRSFRFSGLVTKYRQIYKSMAEQKNVRLRPIGDSRLDVVANPQAVAVIPHTLIDNAVKYSADGGDVEIEINDRDDFIDFAVTSWGPFIKDSEEPHIFDPFFRGADAIKLAENGAGYGLFVSQLVAKTHLGTEIGVTQHRSLMKKDRFRTTFSVSIPMRAAILQ